MRPSNSRGEVILLLKAELGKIGSNINQAVRLANTNRAIDQMEVQELLDALERCYLEITKLPAE